DFRLRSAAPGWSSPCSSRTGSAAVDESWCPCSPPTGPNSREFLETLSALRIPLHRAVPYAHAPELFPALPYVHRSSGSPSCSSLYTQEPAKVSPQRIAQHFLNGAVGPLAPGVLAAAGCVPYYHPVGRAVAGPAVPFRIDEGFHKIDRMTVSALPLSGKHAGHARQKVRGQVRNLHPGQD